ncbi:hypothetical protein HOH87_08375 [bacterium]|jgi:hypothetical protein|nr:hypothetical protein [bacterium]
MSRMGHSVLPMLRTMGLEAYTQSFMRSVNSISFSDSFGFSAFNASDLDTFLDPKGPFGLSLRRQKGKQLLYGKEHAEKRQSFFNNLSKQTRISLFESKLEFYELNHWLRSQVDFVSIVDVLDIGMGSSVFHIQLLDQSGGLTQRVLKSKSSDAQVFYCELLRALGWSTYKTVFYSNSFGGWELTDYLGSQSFAQVLNEGALSDSLVQSVARHAALGDLIGAGDRHFENLMVRDGELFPLDVFYLFWPDNESWTAQYVAAGFSDLSVVYRLSTDQRRLFWAAYTNAFDEISAQWVAIQKVMARFFSGPKGQSYDVFVSERLAKGHQYCRSQMQLVSANESVYLDRNRLKKQLADYVDSVGVDHVASDLIKMYFLCDRDRHSAFFLLDHWVEFLQRDCLEIGLDLAELSTLRTVSSLD